MKSFCMFRESIGAPIFESEFYPEEGTILNVPKDKFEVHIPTYFYNQFECAGDYGLKLDASLYIRALYYANGLVAFNFYDVGITVLTESGIVVMFLESIGNFKTFSEYDFDKSKFFNYDKHIIGKYKTVVYQFDEPQYFSGLYVDSKGKFLTSNGEVSTGIIKASTIDEVNTIKGSVKAWRDGYDGILINNSGNQVKFRVNGPGIDIF